MGQAGPAGRQLEGERLVLRDSSGRVRIGMGIADEGPTLQLMDESGGRRLAPGLAGTDPFVVLYDGTGGPRAALSVAEEGPTLELYDQAGKRRAALTEAGQGAGLESHDPAGPHGARPERTDSLQGAVGRRRPVGVQSGGMLRPSALLTLALVAPAASETPGPTGVKTDLSASALPVRTAEFLSEPYLVDRRFPSMAGPQSVKTIHLLQAEKPELWWVT